MNNALVPLVRTLDLNTRLFLNALDGVDDSVATSRPNESTNHIAFIACHLVEARHYLGNTVGHESSSPFKALEGARGIDDIQEFPTVDEIGSAWKVISERLSSHLVTLGDADLEKELERPFPIEAGNTTLAAITFLIEHDSFHIGQLGFLRRFFRPRCAKVLLTKGLRDTRRPQELRVKLIPGRERSPWLTSFVDKSAKLA